MKKHKTELNGVCNIHESTLVAGEGAVESDGSPSSVDSKRQSAFGQSYDACVHPVELTFFTSFSWESSESLRSAFASGGNAISIMLDSCLTVGIIDW